MVEQAQTSVRKYHIVLIRGLDALRIHDATTWGSKVLHSTPESPMDIIREREECVTRAGNAAELTCMVRALLRRERLRHALKHAFPLLTLAALEDFTANEEINRIRLLGALHSLLERQAQHARVVAQPPQIRFVTCETRAVNTRLLACADAYDRSTVGVRNAVGLSVLESESGNDEVSQGLVRNLDGRELT